MTTTTKLEVYNYNGKDYDNTVYKQQNKQKKKTKYSQMLLHPLCYLR